MVKEVRLIKVGFILISLLVLIFSKKTLKNNELTRKLVHQDLLNVQGFFQIYYW